MDRRSRGVDRGGGLRWGSQSTVDTRWAAGDVRLRGTMMWFVSLLRRRLGGGGGGAVVVAGAVVGSVPPTNPRWHDGTIVPIEMSPHAFVATPDE